MPAPVSSEDADCGSIKALYMHPIQAVYRHAMKAVSRLHRQRICCLLLPSSGGKPAPAEFASALLSAPY